MQHYPGQGNPVLRALAGEMSVRQLAVMIEHLPADNAAVREIYEPISARDLLNDVSDQLRILRAEIYNIVRDPKQEAIEEPDLLPRPGDHLETVEEEIQKTRVKEAQDHLLAVLNRPNPR